MSTFDVVAPILHRAYGGDEFVAGVAENLAEKIDTWPEGSRYETRQEMVLHTCWRWMSRGTTAEAVARQVEEALQGRN